MQTFVTSGPVPPESRLFVGRAAELKRLESWLTEVNCVGAVLGARQTGKTSLLLKLRHTFKYKYAFTFVDLQEIEGAHAHECFNYIAEQMVEQLVGTSGYEELSLPKDNKTFSTFLRKLSGKISAVRVVIILDEIGALPSETAIRLASTIRAVFTDRFIKPEFARYIFLLSGATDMLELTTGRNSPLGNVTNRIYLSDLSLAESEQLLSEGYAEASMCQLPEVVCHVHAWTSGHPYWTQLLGSTLENQSQPMTEEGITNIVDHLIRTEDKNLPHVIRSVKAEEALWILVESLLNSVPVSFSRSNATVARLELIGVVKDQDGRCSIRNRIYREAIYRHQIKPVRRFAQSLRSLSQEILAASNPESLLRYVAGFVQQELQSRTVMIYAKGPSERSLRVSATIGIPETLCRDLEVAAGGRLLGALERGAEPSTLDLPGPEEIQLRKMANTVVVPVTLKGALLGFLSLGGKLSGEEYDAQDREFLATVAEHVAGGIERISLHQWKQDAETARDIQQDLLPKEILQIPGVQICGIWQPARLVGGDYYDVLKFDTHKIALCIADVVGKGMPAALLMSNLQAAVKAFASGSIAPKVLCERVNQLISNNIATGKFITFFYGLVDGEARRLTYTNAGHNPPIMIRNDGTVLRLDAGGALLGVFPDWKYSQGDIELGSGDRLVLFTDGVSEVQDSEGHEFGEERLIHFLMNNRELDAVELQQMVIGEITAFSSGDFHDDVTLVLLAVS